MNKMKNILITGSEGFIGSHLVEELILKGYNIKCLVLYNSFNSIGNLSYLNKNLLKKVEIVFGDIRDNNLISDISKNCSTIINLAALIGIPYSYKAVRSYIDVNIIGTQNLLDAAVKNNISKFIHTSTSEIYGSAQFTPMDESHPYVAQSPYSASKISADALVTAYNKSFNLNTLILRPFNTFGPRQSQRAVIPTIIQQALKQNKVFLGDLKPRRDFTYVTDTANAFEKAINLNNKFSGEIINLGTGYSVSVLKITNIISKLLNKKLNIISKNERYRPKNSEVKNLLSSNIKAKKILKWKPVFNGHDGLKKGLLETINFYEKNFLSLKKTNKFIY